MIVIHQERALAIGVLAAPVIASIRILPPIAGEAFGSGEVLDTHPPSAPPQHARLAIGALHVDRLGMLEKASA